MATETARAYRAFAAGNHAEAAEQAKRILGRSPQDPAALTLVGRLAIAAGEPDVALPIFERLLEKHPRMAALWLDLSLALRDLGRHERARDAAQRAVALEANGPTPWVRLGEILLSLNERPEAGRAFRRALELAPHTVAAFRGLGQAEEVDSDSNVVRRMEALARSAKPTPRQRAELHYTLAQIHRRAGHHDEFIRHLFAANSTQRALCTDGRAEYDAIFDRLEGIFTEDAFARAAHAGAVDPVPIFVLGMPRSGTTLVEQLLAAHPEVAAGGELDYVRGPLRRAFERATGQAFPQGFEAVPAQHLNEMARAFARRLAFTGNGARCVTDKTPGNFHLLGLLRVLFPHGPVVHVRRDPMDTCFSILQYPFDDRSPHTSDVALLAHVYARYVRLMERWNELFGNAFVTVEYERLVASPGPEARRVFEHCGLEWHDAYLDSFGAGGAVRTFSAQQVRKPVYTSSVGAWREYAEALAPLREALEAELSR